MLATVEGDGDGEGLMKSVVWISLLKEVIVWMWLCVI